MKNIFVFMGSVLLLLLLFGYAFTYSDHTEGKKIFTDSKCGTCHSVTSEGLDSKKKDAVDLSTVGDSLTADFLTRYLKKEESADGEKHKIAFKGSDEELKALTSWLESLKTPQN